MKLVRGPVLCNYYLTYRCNARCHFCDIWEKPSPYVDSARFDANLRDLERLGVRVIDFTGGEPLLHREAPAFIKRAKEAGFITTLTTNALLYPKRAEELRGAVDMLHFSLDYADAEKHNQTRGVACFDHVLKSISIARSFGERPDILFTVMNDNIAEIEGVYENIILPNDLMLLLNPIFEYNAVGGGLDFAHFPALRRWAKKKNVYLNEAFLRLREAGGNDVNAPVCAAGDVAVVIGPDNTLLLPCYHAAAKQFEIEDRLYELWFSDEVKAARALQGKMDACKGCAVNCYMQPSFAAQVNRYFFYALPSTLKYSLEKWGFVNAIKINFR